MQSVSKNGEIQGPSSERALANALDLCYKLKLNEAEVALADVIKEWPAADDAYSALALIKLMQGRPDQQRQILENTLEQSPTHYASLHQLAIALFRAGHYEKAYESVSRALSTKPSSVSSLLLASRLCLLLHDDSEAYKLAKQALRESKGWQPEASNLMADALIHSSDKPSELCDKLFDELIAGQGDAAKINATTHLIINLQQRNQSLNRIEREITSRPDNLHLRLLRVRLLSSAGEYDECFPDIYYLLSLDPMSPLVLYSLADTLLALKRYREALQVYLKIDRITGSDCLLLNQIGACYRLMSRFRSAEKAFWRSIRQNPLDSTIIGNLGEISFRLGDFRRAKLLYSISLNINPLFKIAFYNKMLLFSVGPAKGMGRMRKEANDYWSIYRSTHSVAPCASTLDTPTPIYTITRSIHSSPSIQFRVGILSADIGNHCVSYFLSSFLRHYNRDRFHIELILCDRRHESREEEICSYVNHAYSIEGLAESMARDKIRSQKYDLIIECNGYTSGTGISLLADRCAPIQCHYIGYHASTGLDTIDYFISDQHILSSSVTNQLSEKPLKLDRAWLAFSTFEDFPVATSTAKVKRPILGFFGNSTKITDCTLAFWSALFQNCPDAILALKCLSYRDSCIIKKVLNKIESAGIERSRVAIFEPAATWRDHLEYYNLIDYALDSTFWSSATTGFDALGMGVPLLAIQGNTIAARMSSSLVTYLGRKEWIATTPSDYAKLGAIISSEFMEARENKKELQSDVMSSSLFDGPDLARSLEKALLQALQNNSTAHLSE